MVLISVSETTLVILLIGASVLIAFASDYLATRFRIPDVLWLIAFGLIAGPVLGLVRAPQVVTAGAVLGTAALIIILYDAGIDFNAIEARAFAGRAILFALGSFAAATGLLFAFAYFLLTGGNVALSALFALALGGISGAVIIPIAHRIGLPESLKGTLHLDAAIEDAVAVLAVTILVSVMVGSGTGPGQIALEILLPIPIAVLAGVAGGVAALQFLARWQRRSYAGLATMGLLFLVYGLTQAVDGAGIIAALIMGVIIGNEPLIRRWMRVPEADSFAFDPSVRGVHNEVAFLLRALFLVVLGILVPFQPLGILAVVCVLALPFLLLFTRRAIARRMETSGRFEPGSGRPLADLYGRGLTNAVLLIVPLALVPSVSTILLPGFLIIIATDIIMTVLIFLEEPGSGTTARLARAAPPGARPPLPAEPEPDSPALAASTSSSSAVSEL